MGGGFDTAFCEFISFFERFYGIEVPLTIDPDSLTRDERAKLYYTGLIGKSKIGIST